MRFPLRSIDVKDVSFPRFTGIDPTRDAPFILMDVISPLLLHTTPAHFDKLAEHTVVSIGVLYVHAHVEYDGLLAALRAADRSHMMLFWL